MLLQKNIIKKYLNLLGDVVAVIELKDLFNQRVAECQELSAQITAADNEIDNRVFDLYGLIEEEREIVMTT